MAIDELPGGAGRTPLGPAFPQRNAFVLQLSADSRPHTGLFHGRVQHVASGRQAVFGSFDELRQFVAEVLLASSGVTVPAAGDG